MSEKMKKDFLDWKQSRISSTTGYERTFKLCRKFEIRFKKDLSEFTKKQIDEMYREINTPFYYSLYVTHNQLKDYTEWCRENCGVKKNNYTFILRDEKDLYINEEKFDRSVLSCSDVMEMLAKIKNPRDKVLFLGVFEGIRGKTLIDDFIHIHIEDVERVINQNGRAVYSLLLPNRKEPIEISEQLYGYMLEAREADSYLPVHGWDKASNKPRALYDDGTVVKSIASSGTSDVSFARSLYVELRRVMDYLDIGKDVNPLSLRDSGMIHYINTKALEQGMLPDDFIIAFRDQINNQFGVDIRPSIFREKYYKYLVQPE